VEFDRRVVRADINEGASAERSHDIGAGTERQGKPPGSSKAQGRDGNRSAAMLRRNSQEHLNMNVDELDGFTEDGPIADRAPVVHRP
jgi:hypothetical protein